MKSREPATEFRRITGIRADRLKPGQAQRIVVDPAYADDGHDSRCGKPLESGRFGREESPWGTSPLLDEITHATRLSGSPSLPQALASLTP